MRLTALALALLLAGCLAPPAPPEAPPAPPPPALARYGVPVSAVLSAKSNMVCPPQVSCLQESDVLLVELLANQTATGFVLDVVGDRLTVGSAEVQVEVRCSGARVCREPLAQREGPLPFTMRANVTLPPGASLTLAARSLDDSPDPFGFTAPYLQVEGTVAVEGLPGPPPRTVETALHLRGVAGHCAFFVEANCTSWPGGAFWDLPMEGDLLRVNLTATWTPTVPANERMRLSVRCYDAPSCPRPYTAEGSSPLRLEVAPEGIGAGASIEIWLSWPDLVQTSPVTVTGVPLRQPFAIDGTLLSTVAASPRA